MTTPDAKRAKLDLSVLLDRGKQQREQIARAKQARKDAKGAKALESEQLNALAKRLESELQWSDVAIVHQFEKQVCDHCTSEQTILLGTFIKQEHRRDPTAQRKLRASHNLPNLPIERDVWHTHVAECYDCMESSE